MTTSPLPPPGAPLEHYVSTKPFDPRSIERLSVAQERVYLASQWRLMWWKFKRHRVAVGSGPFLAVLYASILFSEFLAPYHYQTRNIDRIYAPPQAIHLFHEGRFVGPFVYGQRYTLNMTTLKREYTPDQTTVHPIRFFCRGDLYRFWGVFESDVHLFCPSPDGTLFLLGTDRL